MPAGEVIASHRDTTLWPPERARRWLPWSNPIARRSRTTRQMHNNKERSETMHEKTVRSTRAKILVLLGSMLVTGAVYAGTVAAHSGHPPCGTIWGWDVQASCTSGPRHLYGQGFPAGNGSPRRVSSWCGGSGGSNCGKLAECTWQWAATDGLDDNNLRKCTAYTFDGSTQSAECPSSAKKVKLWNILETGCWL